MKIEYELIRSFRRSLSIEIKRGGKVTVRAPYAMEAADIEKFITQKSAWIEKHLADQKESESGFCFDDCGEEQIKELKAVARKTVLPMVEYYSKILGVEYSSVKINRAKKRFGSCSGKNNLNFSCFLMLYPKQAIEYVVVHELCHIIEHNHSKSFYALVESVLGDYKAREKLLKKPPSNE